MITDMNAQSIKGGNYVDASVIINKESLQHMITESAQQGAIMMFQLLKGEMLFDNVTADITDMLGEDNGMSKQLKERVQVGVNEQGKPVYRWATGYDRQQLILSAAKILQEHGRIEESENKKKTASYTFAQYAQEWLSLYKAGNIRHTTYSEYASLLNKHLIPEFGEIDISEITTNSIQMMLNNKRNYAKKTLNEILMVLAMVLDGAVEDELIKKNPAKSKRLKNPSDKKTERIALTEEQLSDIIVNIPQLSQARDRRYLALLIYTGMRREEVLGLKWTDIDYERLEIHVERAMTFKGNQPVLGKTKTEKGVRTVPLNKALLQWLTMEDENKEFIVQDHMSQQIVKRMWERISREINVYGATPHCFRHSFATICRRHGMDEKTLQKIGGWSDIETLRNIYTHTQDKDYSIAAGVMNSAFSFDGVAM